MLAEILLFLVAYPFTKKINAVGISNVPAALDAYRRAKSQELKRDAKRRMMSLGVCLLHSSVVFSALFGRWPRLIIAHSVACIVWSVKESVDGRREEEERAKRLEAERRMQRRGRGWETVASVTGRLRDWMFGAREEEDEEEDDDDPSRASKTAKAQRAVRKTKRILRGKRDSATDDVVWGAFQVSFVLLDQTVGQALAYAWLLFALTVLEEAVFNPKLRKRQRMKRFSVVAVTVLVCRNWLLSDFFGGFLLRPIRYILSLASRSA